MRIGRARLFGVWSTNSLQYHCRLLRAPPGALSSELKTRLENTVVGFSRPREVDMLRRLACVVVVPKNSLARFGRCSSGFAIRSKGSGK